jgi:uncharacterized protein YktA (UPF0223 family)
MMARGLLKIDTLEEKTKVLTKPTVNKGENYNVFPYNYHHYCPTIGPALVFHAKIGRLSRDGRCLAPEELVNHSKIKRKEMMDLLKTYEIIKPLSEEKATDFLKLMKYSEYSIVDQLKKTPTNIFLLSLILSLELHRNTL